MAQPLIQLKIDDAALKGTERILRALPRAFPRVMRRAINRTVDSAATDLKRRAAERIKLPKREIARGIGKHKANYSRLSGAIDALPHRPALTKFKGTRQLKRGVKYRIGVGGYKLVAHSFIATMPSGHRGVFLRATYARGQYIPMKGDSSKEMIFQLKGPSIWHVITDTAGLLAAVNEKTSANLNKQVNDYIGLELRKWRNR